MNAFLINYQSLIRRNLSSSVGNDDQDLTYWQGQLFYNFLVYCLPVSLIALIPGVYMSIRDGFPTIAAVDLGCFALIAAATFNRRMKARYRKILVISVFYFLALYLINALGYIGPGIFYLFFITVLIGLIFPVRYAYRSVILNAAILTVFALMIYFKVSGSVVVTEYTVGKWIAFSANLIFASTVIVLVIDKIFEGLQLTIGNKSMLEERYRLIFDKSPLPMWLFDTETFRFLDVNEAAVAHYGYEKHDFLSMTIMDIRHKEQIPETVELVHANKLSGKYYSGNAQHVKKSGEMIYVKIESNLLKINGRSVRLVQVTDITSQVKHQIEVDLFNHKIKESESNLHALFNSAIDGVILLDEHACIKIFQ
jgi:PAS domain S-box-containing protein